MCKDCGNPDKPVNAQAGDIGIANGDMICNQIVNDYAQLTDGHIPTHIAIELGHLNAQLSQARELRLIRILLERMLMAQVGISDTDLAALLASDHSKESDD